MMGFWHGSGISWIICKQSAPRSRQITTPAPHHSIFTGRMQWHSGKYLFGGTHGEREPITGVWGQSPQRSPGAEPLVGVRGAKPP